MANEMEMRTAKEMFCVLCLALDEMGWKYKKEEENLAVRFDATGNDLSTSFTFWVDADRKLFRLMGFLPLICRKTNEWKALSPSILQTISSRTETSIII